MRPRSMTLGKHIGQGNFSRGESDSPIARHNAGSIEGSAVLPIGPLAPNRRASRIVPGNG
jgi:hypothetical protein